MVKVIALFLFSLLAFSTVLYALASPTPPASRAQPPLDAVLVFSPDIAPMPMPKMPFDETPITPVESAGAPMWP